MANVQIPEIAYKPIGILHSLHTKPEDTPIQPVYAVGCEGHIDLDPALADGLVDLDGFSHIFLLYHFHKAPAPKLRVKPFLQDVEHGVFATRAPCRPNPIGLSIVRLLRIEGATLHLTDVDLLDGTPILDIKPYTAKFDLRPGVRSGWQDEVDEQTAGRRGLRGFVPKDAT